MGVRSEHWINAYMARPRRASPVRWVVCFSAWVAVGEGASTESVAIWRIQANVAKIPLRGRNPDFWRPF